MPGAVQGGQGAHRKPNMISSWRRWASSSMDRMASVSISSQGRKRLFRLFFSVRTTCGVRVTFTGLQGPRWGLGAGAVPAVVALGRGRLSRHKASAQPSTSDSPHPQPHTGKIY